MARKVIIMRDVNSILEARAIFSKNRRFRYWLSRGIEGGAGIVVFIMLNPSTADAEIDDNTITRCMGYAKKWGYGTLIVVNLYAYRSTSPDFIKNISIYSPPRIERDFIGEENNFYMDLAVKVSDKVICAWGSPGEALNKGDNIISKYKNTKYRDKFHYLTLTKTKQPGHPLYLPKQLEPKKFFNCRRLKT